MRHKGLLFILLVLMPFTMLWSAGRTEESDYDEVSGLKNWDQEVNLQDRKDGLYNLIIRGTDQAGNVAFAGPVNVYVDPDSDLPRARFSAPLPGQRAGGLLQVVGTARDDDGIAMVEIRIDQGPWQQVKGTEYWSFPVDGRTMEDGRHELTIRATDVNNLVGPEMSTHFHLDKFKPRTDVESLAQGTIVSGTLSITGVVSDLNGVVHLEVSRDQGTTWEALRLAHDRRSGTYSFKTSLDTRRVPDGPQVWWFRARDGQGSVGQSAFLFFVDNSPPQLEILKPLTGAGVQGRTAILGRIQDEVGLKSLSFLWNKETIAIPLVPGDPFFSLSLDLPITGKSLRIPFTAVDLAGNVRVVNHEVTLDPVANLPVLTLAYPRQEDVLDAQKPGLYRVLGHYRDDDGPGSVEYRIGTLPPARLETGGAFMIELPPLPSGTHTFVARGIDSQGTPGPETRLQLRVNNTQGAIRIKAVQERGSQGQEERAFVPGIRIHRDRPATLLVDLELANPVKTASLTLPDGTLARTVAGKRTAEGIEPHTVPIPSTLPYGLNRLVFRVEDAFGNVMEEAFFVEVADYTRIQDPWGFYHADPRTALPAIPLGEGKPFSLLFVGPGIQNVTLDPPGTLVRATPQGNSILVEAAAPGLAKDVAIKVVTVDGKTFTSERFSFLTDVQAPLLSFTQGSAPGFPGTKPVWKGTLTDTALPLTVEYLVGKDETWIPAKVSGTSFEIPFPDTVPSAISPVRLRIADGLGNSKEESYPLWIDRDGPDLRVFAPYAGPAETKAVVLVQVRDIGGVGRVEWRADDKAAWLPLSPDSSGLASLVAPLPANHAGTLLFRALDRASNETILSYDLRAPSPAAGTQVPQVRQVPPRNSFTGAENLLDRSPMAAQDLRVRLDLSTPNLPPSWEGRLAEMGGTAPALGILYPQTRLLATTPMLGGWWHIPATAQGRVTPPRVVVKSGDGPELNAEVLGNFWRLPLADLDPGSHRIQAWLVLADGQTTAPQEIEFEYRPTALHESYPIPLVTAGGSLQASLPDLGPGALWTLEGWTRTAVRLPSSSVLAAPTAGQGLAFLRASVPGGATYAMALPWMSPAASTIRVTSVPGPSDGKAYRFIGAVEGLMGLLTLELMGVEGSLEFDTSSQAFLGQASFAPGREGTLSFRGQDILGRPVVHSIKVPLDTALDRPQVDWLIDAGTTIAAGQVIHFRPRDDDGAPSVSWRWKGSADWSALESRDIYSVPVTGAGNRTLEVRLIDPSGLEVIHASPAFTVRAPAPELQITGSRDQRGETAFTPGSLVGEVQAALLVKVRSDHGIKRLAYRFAEGSWQNLAIKTSTESVQDFALPVNLVQFGRIGVEIQVEDQAGQITEARSFFHRVDKTFTGEVNRQNALYLLDRRIGEDRRITLRTGDRITGFYFGRPIARVAFVPATDLVQTSFDGQQVILQGSRNGISGKLQLRLETIDGDVEVLNDLVLVVDDGPPTVEIQSPAPGFWTKGPLEARAGVSDTVSIESVHWSLDFGTTRVPVTLAGAAPRLTSVLTIPVDLAGVQDGPRFLLVTAQDTAGNEGSAWVPFNLDTQAPTIALVSPPQGLPVNGIFTLGGGVIDAAPLDQFSLQVQTDPPRILDKGADFAFPVDLSAYASLPVPFRLEARDLAGNVGTLDLIPTFDPLADAPRVLIQAPMEGEVLRQDFAVTGMAFDDDGIAALSYRLDDGPWLPMEAGNNFSIPLKMLEVGDNEHRVEIKAGDLNGKESEVVVRRFRISTEEPVAFLTSPDIASTNRGLVTLRGTASDANGIAEVWISIDNGNTHAKASGTESWSWTFDTRSLPDGVYSVQMKSLDAYGTVGLSASTLTIDNTAPQVALDKPLPGEDVMDTVTIDGRAWDSFSKLSLGYRINQLDLQGRTVSEVARGEITEIPVFVKELPLAGLTEGWYNIRVEATDHAGNVSYASKNFRINRNLVANKIDILFPMEGDVVQGTFVIEGRVETHDPLESVALRIRDGSSIPLTVNPQGYFSHLVDPSALSAGALDISVSASPGGQEIKANRSVGFNPEGPWVLINNVRTGDFIRNRPFLEGTSGWHLAPPTPPAEGETPRTTRELQQEARTRLPVKVEVSIDNGITYQEAEGTQNWKFRLETLEWADGAVYVMVRSTFANGALAFTKSILTLDQTPPDIVILDPSEGGRFNGSLVISGQAVDNHGIRSVQTNLREGDKSSYEVPGFIQGMYLDFHALGSTTWEAGVGLTFFDDNVRLQALMGSAPTGRFEGYALGAKLLANIAKVPFSSLFGPDFASLQTAFAVGAKFTYFTMDTTQFSLDQGVMLGAVVLHWDMLRFSYDWPVFNSLTVYSEGEIWMISSDVQAGFLPKLGFGLSIDIL